MKELSIMIKPASSLCNMRCRYCFYADVSSLREIRSFGIMKKEVMISLLDHVFADIEQGDKITFAFQGGEPTVAGIEYFRSFVAETEKRNKGISVSYAIQTNGTGFTDEWYPFLKENNFLVGISIDGLKDLHDRNRLDARGDGTFSQIMKTKKLLEQWKIEYNVLTVLTDAAARHPQQIWNFIRQQNIRYIQFIPCLDVLNPVEPSVYALTPRNFASFYIRLFQLWLKEWESGNYISIKLFDDVINLLTAGIRSACGITGECTPQIVVEANGSTYPCDFYVLDEYCAGNLSEQNVREVYESPVMSEFRNRPHQQPELCAKCRYLRICGGGCKRMQREVCCSDTDKTCGYQEFLDACLPNMEKIAYSLRRERQLR